MSGQLYFYGEKENVDGINYRYLPFINSPILRQICLFSTGFYHILIWCMKNREGILICDVLDITISSAALLASKIARIKSVGIVTDVPSVIAGKFDSRLSRKDKIKIIINTFIINSFNSYVFLTKYMNDLVNKENKPNVVIEGQVDINMANTTNKISDKHEKKICIYAGALRNIYGLKLLTDAFIAADNDGAELHIYGSGDFEEELKIICMEHHNIKYFGVVANDIVVQEQLKATLLINPRPTNEEYTKYSFPSKNMEYMVSGTPTLTSNLPGMPEEYKQYVYIIEDETVEGLTNTLKVVLSKTKEELHQKGQEAKQFVLDNKNNVVQAKEIIDMITMIN
jgi:glycosyltransferase involved in cell wall biosynthesis